MALSASGCQEQQSRYKSSQSSSREVTKRIVSITGSEIIGQVYDTIWSIILNLLLLLFQKQTVMCFSALIGSHT